jgi:hypothetical protein
MNKVKKSKLVECILSQDNMEINYGPNNRTWLTYTVRTGEKLYITKNSAFMCSGTHSTLHREQEITTVDRKFKIKIHPKKYKKPIKTSITLPWPLIHTTDVVVKYPLIASILLKWRNSMCNAMTTLLNTEIFGTISISQGYIVEQALLPGDQLILELYHKDQRDIKIYCSLLVFKKVE